jgi:formylmethanofuran--tetrahydromethanopterin N-formyltransferase
MGGNFWYLCETPEAVIDAGDAIIEAIMNVEGATAPFDICSAASKPETNFPEIGPTTNHFYCPSLKGRLGDESKVPEGVNYIPEVVINAIDEESMNKAVKAGIDAALKFEGVIGISAGNFDGKLGDKNINLLDILK